MINFVLALNSDVPFDLESSERLRDLANKDIAVMKCPQHPKHINTIALRVSRRQPEFSVIEPCCDTFARDVRTPLAVYMNMLSSRGLDHLWQSND